MFRSTGATYRLSTCHTFLPAAVNAVAGDHESRLVVVVRVDLVVLDADEELRSHHFGGCSSHTDAHSWTASKFQTPFSVMTPISAFAASCAGSLL